jgi:FkbM family methyltransferase
MIKRTLIKVLEFIRYKKSYAQDGEDTALYGWYDGKKGYKGYFVDVGAHHPVRFSNTMMFYKMGWKGINIDPTPGSMTWFNRLRNRDINLEMGVGGKSDIMTFHCFDEPALNTFDAALAKARNTGNPYKIIKEIGIPIEPLSSILDKYLPQGQQIDFFSIDVEGLDLEVLKSNNWEKYQPLFVLVEDVDFSLENPTASETFVFLKSKGYHLVAALKRTIIYKKN